uniref:Uncharacterized protein n=1 Tax=Rhizophora mucronata TaxID=61149 RepID=A0A2P2PNJ1_RHIMU
MKPEQITYPFNGEPYLRAKRMIRNKGLNLTTLMFINDFIILWPLGKGSISSIKTNLWHQETS